MSVWPNSLVPTPVLSGLEGELISIRVNTDPRHLEDLLECLSELSFPINPQIYHGKPTAVEFPAYEGNLPEVKAALAQHGFPARGLEVRGVLACSERNS